MTDGIQGIAHNLSVKTIIMILTIKMIATITLMIVTIMIMNIIL